MLSISHSKEEIFLNQLNKNIYNTHCKICHLVTQILIFLSLSNFFLIFLFWYTNFFSNAIITNLKLKNGSLSFLLWQKPLVRAVYRVRVFNYTNLEDFESRKVQKLHIEEAGPYIYRETLSRINPKIENDGTITYQEKREYKWEGGHPDSEIVNVPNIPLFTAMAFSRDMSFLAQVSLTAVLSTIQAKHFIKISAGDFLWGYDDKLFQIAKPILKWQQNIPYEKFGVLVFVSIKKKKKNILSSLKKNFFVVY